MKSTMLLLFLSLSAFAQSKLIYADTHDLSEFFPEIAGCVKTVGELKREDDALSQEAVYEVEGYVQGRNDPNYFGCGSITFRSFAGIRKLRDDSWSDYFPSRKLKVQEYDAWRNSPLCGNDPSRGSLEVYFGDDVVLVAAETIRGPGILAYAEQADYNAIRKTIRRLRE